MAAAAAAAVAAAAAGAALGHSCRHCWCHRLRHVPDAVNLAPAFVVHNDDAMVLADSRNHWANVVNRNPGEQRINNTLEEYPLI